MRFGQAWLVAAHDLGMVRQRRSILYGLVAFPLAVAVGFPLLVRYIIDKTSAAALSRVLPGLVDSFNWWFVVAAATLPIAIASYSIVGEKIEKSLEPLLATPTTDSEILLGKALTAFLPTILSVWAGSALYMTLMDRVTASILGPLYYPNWEMAVILLALTPLACMFTIEVSILISSKVSDLRTAQQYAGLIFLPFVLLYIVGEIGAVTLDTTNLLYISGALAVVVVALFTISRKTFHREEILTRWK